MSLFETRRSRRALSLGAAALLLTVAAVDTVAWSVGCRRLEDGVREAATAAGWTLSAGPALWGGWPDAAEVTMPDTVLRAGPDVIPPLTWTVPNVIFRLSAWHPMSLTASASGAQALTIGSAPPVPFTAQHMVSSIDLAAHDPVRIAAQGLEVTAPNGPVRAVSADLLILPDGLSVDLSGLTMSGYAGQPITPPIDSLRLDGRISPPIEPQATPAESARFWRSRNGSVDLQKFALRWGPLDATGNATLTLDPALQPAITGQVTAIGLASVIERFAQTGAITRASATAAQGILAILSAPTGGGPVTLPVALREGVVSVARVPLLRFSPLQWD